MPFWVGAQNGVPAEGVIRQIPLKVRAPLTSRLRSPPSGNRTGAAQSQPSPSCPRGPKRCMRHRECAVLSDEKLTQLLPLAAFLPCGDDDDLDGRVLGLPLEHLPIRGLPSHRKISLIQIQNHLSRTRVTIAANTTAPMLPADAGPSRESSSQSP